jgi:hypothetical protein
MRYVVVALALGAGIAWLGFYAAGHDDYYSDGGVSRWEHAARADSTSLVVAAIAVSTAIALAFLVRGIFPTRLRLGALVFPALALYCVSSFVAWFFLTAGH